MKITIPTAIIGRPTQEAKERYLSELKDFANTIKEVVTTLDFSVSSRGWCYMLEPYGLTKGQFDYAQRLINDCRKNGLLPVDICAEDMKRAATNITQYYSPDDFSAQVESAVKEYETTDFRAKIIESHVRDFFPEHFMDSQRYYIEMIVEKVDLVGLFSPVCEKYHVAIGNTGGWSDLNSRFSMLKRFKQWYYKGKTPVILYCGDFDPKGLVISEFIRSNLRDLENAAGFGVDNIIIDRFGLNFDFIQENNLTWIDNLETSSGDDLSNPKNREYKKDYVQTYLKEYGSRKVEANALVTNSKMGRELCEKSILKYFNEYEYSEYFRRLDVARSEIRAAMYERLQ